jgi:predicted nucleotidyltransferase
MELARPLALITPTVDGDVLAVLAGSTASFTGRQVHQIAARHSERGVRNSLHRLCEQGIVTRERVGSADVYQLNRRHLASGYIERLARIRTELLDNIVAEVGAWKVKALFVALFGSAARGEMRPDSDIDLFVVRPNMVEPDDEPWQRQLVRLADKVTGWTGNDARILELGESEVSTAGRVVDDIQKDGISLFGSHGHIVSMRRGGDHA